MTPDALGVLGQYAAKQSETKAVGTGFELPANPWSSLCLQMSLKEICRHTLKIVHGITVLVLIQD